MLFHVLLTPDTDTSGSPKITLSKRHVAQLASSESWGYLANVGPGEWQKSHHDYAQAPIFFVLPINPPQNARGIIPGIPFKTAPTWE